MDPTELLAQLTDLSALDDAALAQLLADLQAAAEDLASEVTDEALEALDDIAEGVEAITAEQAARAPAWHCKAMDDKANVWARAAAVVVGLFALVVLVFGSVTADGTTRVTKTTTAADGSVTVETTESPADDSAWDLALSRGGDVLVRLGLAVAAAFLAGAVVQRVVLGKFAFKAGGMELPDVTEVTTATIEALQAELRKQGRVARRAARDAAAALQAVSESDDGAG